ncbi:MAG TPA: universal stress protein, partial [Pyrinomonadaceae bacterium]|nr:universal stress protein [Pyrinomonadaceae bacterium]
MKVLLSIDSSEISETVIADVERRPWPPDTTVCVLSVLDMFALTSSVGYLEMFWKQETAALEEFVQRVADRLAKKGIKTLATVREGYPNIAIVDYANEWGADFVFVGSHGHGGLVRFFVGSVAKAVLHGTKCSVAIVRGAVAPGRPENEGMRILLATDGSEYSDAAARSIAKRPWSNGSQIRVVSAAGISFPTVDLSYTTGPLNEQVRQVSIDQAKDAVAEATRILEPTGLVTSSEVVLGNPKTRLLDEATEWKADLIVAGSHGRRGISRVLLGSVAEGVAMRAHCSVEVIRERGA